MGGLWIGRGGFVNMWHLIGTLGTKLQVQTWCDSIGLDVVLCWIGYARIRGQAM